MRILLARHGETPWNAEGRYQGQEDIPLSPVGEAQAHVLLLRNEDRPGMIGTVGSQLGSAGINIVNFALGAAGDGQARAAITVDRELADDQLVALRATPGILSLQQV